MQNLPCLSDEDYADYGTYMKCLAEDLDAKFTEKNNELLSVRNTYAGVWRNLSPLVSDGGGNWNLGPATMTNVFWNDPNNPSATGTGTLTNPSRFLFPGMVPGGLYQIGATVFFNQGATANSTRQLQSFVNFQSTTSFVTAIAVNAATEESLTGGEGLYGDYQLSLSSREIAPGSGNFGTPIGFTASAFESDAGAVTIVAGACVIYAVFIGTNTLIGGSA